MSYGYMTKTELPDAFKTQNLDKSVQNAIIQQLIHDGLYSKNSDSQKIWVESDKHLSVGDGGVGNQPFSKIQLLEVEGKDVTVQTDPALKVIVDDGENHGINRLTVKGDDNEFIALGNNDTRVTLSGLGNDTVLAGDGNDTIKANDGDDSLVAGSGDDLLAGGKGHDTLVGGSGEDTLTGGSGPNWLIAGTGHGSLLEAGSGDTHITDRKSGGYDTLVAGSGSDTITGQQGDHFTTMGASGNDVYNIFDGHGNSTINLGSGNDTVNFFTSAGNDTINNAGGTDTIDFTNSAAPLSSDVQVQELHGANSGDYLLKFTDGQTMRLNAHTVAGEAFELKFADGSTQSLPGGH
jgi:Ca2+-binding RTX toxin-like protein